MKKILCTLLFVLISVNMFSMKLLEHIKIYCDPNSNFYIETTIKNNSNKYISHITFVIEYDTYLMIDSNRYKTVKMNINIKPREIKKVRIYVPSNDYDPFRLYVNKIVFSDRTYKKF